MWQVRFCELNQRQKEIFKVYMMSYDDDAVTIKLHYYLGCTIIFHSPWLIRATCIWNVALVVTTLSRFRLHMTSYWQAFPNTWKMDQTLHSTRSTSIAKVFDAYNKVNCGCKTWFSIDRWGTDFAFVAVPERVVGDILQIMAKNGQPTACHFYSRHGDLHTEPEVWFLLHSLEV